MQEDKTLGCNKRAEDIKPRALPTKTAEFEVIWNKAITNRPTEISEVIIRNNYNTISAYSKINRCLFNPLTGNWILIFPFSRTSLELALNWKFEIKMQHIQNWRKKKNKINFDLFVLWIILCFDIAGLKKKGFKVSVVRNIKAILTAVKCQNTAR